MTTLEEAWGWYNALRRGVGHLSHLADYWTQLPWDGDLGRDNVLRGTTAAELRGLADDGRGPLNDLAVLVLFSVFESIVREEVRNQVRPEAEGLTHPALRRAARDAVAAIDDGSFFRVLEPYKDGHADLVEEVNQVRRYRNWVAHGRRGKPDDAVTPRAAFDRLRRFLTVIRPPAPDPNQ